MKIIRPLTVADAMLTSNIAEDDEVEWTSGGSFDTGARCMVTTTANGASAATHMIYESLINTNTANDPADRVNNALKWLEVSATNRWKMLDGKLLDQSSNALSVAITISPGEVANALALFELDAESLNVTVTDPIEGGVYNNTISLVDNSTVTDWHAYFFEPIVRESEVVLFDLPHYGSADIGITLAVSTGDALLGEVVLGLQKNIGDAQYGSSVGIVDYSRKEKDAFGNPIVVERAYSQRADFDISLPTKDIRALQKTLTSFRATPIVWAGKDDGDYGLLIYGYYNDFDIQIATPTISDCTIQVEGLS